MSVRRLAPVVLLVACAPPPVSDRTAARPEPFSGPCGVQIAKVKYAEGIGDVGAHQFVELRVATPNGATFGECGIGAIVPWTALGTSACKPMPASHVVDLANVAIPDGGTLLIGRGGGSSLSVAPDVTSAGTSGIWLPNDHGLLVLTDVAGDPIRALAIARDGEFPSCTIGAGTVSFEPLPPDPGDAEKADLVAIPCGGTWTSVPLASSPPKAPSHCPPVDGARACVALVSRIDVVQPPRDGAPPNPAQAIEIAVVGDAPAGTTLGQCGASTLVAIDANDDDGGCGTAATYLEVLVDDLPIPDSKRLVIGARHDSDRAWPATSPAAPLLEHAGYVALRDRDRNMTSRVRFPRVGGQLLPTCGGELDGAEDAPADANSEENVVVARCESGGFGYSNDVWKIPTTCDAHPVDAGTDAIQEDAPTSGGPGEIDRAAEDAGAPDVGDDVSIAATSPSCGCRSGSRSKTSSVAGIVALIVLRRARRRSRGPMRGS